MARKLLGGEAIKGQLGKRGLKADLRILKKALEDSQHRRAELEAAAGVVERIARERDDYFTEVVRLRAENVALRAALDRLDRGEGRRER